MSDFFKAMMDLEALNTPAPRAKIEPSSVLSASPTMSWDDNAKSILHCREYPVEIIALAGTGKTELLLEFARRHDRMKWRYVAFNKALTEAVQERFPNNVRGRTFHAIAYAQFAEPLRTKIHIRFNADTVRRWVGWGEFPSWEMAVAALRQWRKGFMSSASPLPSLGQLPPDAWKWLVSNKDVLENIGGPDGFMKAAQKFWDGTIDSRQTQIDAPLDATVKLMCLADFKWGTHGVLVDEAQDLSACLIQALLKQKIPVVMAGDPSQNLYEWRTGLNSWPNTQSPFSLTGSWRFGAEIAEHANQILAHLGRQEQLVGKKQDSSVSISSCEWKPGMTWVARTQAGAMEGAMKALAAGFTPTWIGQGTLDRITALVDLTRFKASQNPWLSGLKDLGQVEKMAEESGALEWISAIRMIKAQSSDGLWKILEILKDPRGGEVNITTVHQAKGRTFDSVYLASDIKWESLEPGELRTNYVAWTRSAHVGMNDEDFSRWQSTMKSSITSINQGYVETDDGF